MAGQEFWMPEWFAFHLKRVLRQLWVTAAAYCVFAIAAALAAVIFAPLVPDALTKVLGSDAVDQILVVLAGSMLAVATFSLAAATTVFGLAAQTTTPRAIALLVEDRGAQRALSTFIGAFLYSIVGLVALATDFYGPQGRVILFVLTLVVIGAVIVTLISWIDTLTHFGRVGDTIERVERATMRAVDNGLAHGGFAGSTCVDPPGEAVTICPDRVGFLQHIDMGSLQRLQKAHGLSIHVLALPGTFVHLTRPLIAAEGRPTQDCIDALRNCFVVGDHRTFEEDPRFGLVVLSEIASRALSPAVNDPGTAIAVIATQTRILTRWAIELSHIYGPSENDGSETCVYLPDIHANDIFNDAFAAIARDGAGMAEVVIMLFEAMGGLSEIGGAFGRTAQLHASSILSRAEAGISSREDLARVREAYNRFHGERAAGAPAVMRHGASCA